MYASAQAILFVRPATWDGEQATGLIDDDKSIVDRNDHYALWERFYRDVHVVFSDVSRDGIAPTASSRLYFPDHQILKQRFLRMQSILRLVPHHALRPVDHARCDFFAAMCGQAVHEECL